jgi:hypothetical protein
MGDLVVMIMAMAGLWALVVGVTMALFRGVRCDPAVRRRANPLFSHGRRRRIRLSGFQRQDRAGSS